jgi:glycosyltransferase domain-containing protein
VKPALADEFTLIVPTYNRPVELARLLTYLSRHDARFPVLVLDSSELSTQEANRAMVEKVLPRARFEALDPAISPWEKFWHGSKRVATEFCSLCADDDVVMLEPLARLVVFLREHPDHSVADGRYFTFYLDGHVGITRPVHGGPSLGRDDPVERLLELFRNYEAITYGVYRTVVMKSVLQAVQGVDSMLARELLGGALAAVHGKVTRAPYFFYGRSHSPSHPYVRVHPLDFLVSAPEDLYRDYTAYRSILLSHLKSIAYERHAGAELATLLDLIHFRYLANYTRPGVMDYLAEQKIAGAPKDRIMQGVWSALAREDEGRLTGMLGGSVLVRRIRDRFFPKVRRHHLKRLSAPTAQRTVRSTAGSGQLREYLFYGEFLAALDDDAESRREMDAIIAALDQYE